MRKVTLFFIALIAFMASSRAYDFSAVAPSGQTLYYKIQSGYNVKVTYPNTSVTNMYSGLQWDGYTKPTGDLIIPSTVTYNNYTYTVKYIDQYTFYGCSGLTSVRIPSTITDIYDYAFKFCSSLDSIVMQPCTPPSAIFGYYISIAEGTDIYIDSCACYQNYFNSSWDLYKLHALDVTLPYEYTVTAHTNLGYNGNFSAKGNIVNPCGSADTLELRYYNKEQNYHFSHWSDGSTENPHIVVLTQDTSFEAIFEHDPVTVTVNVNNSSYGYVNITSLQVAYGDTIHLVATPLNGCRFLRWEYYSGYNGIIGYNDSLDLVVTKNIGITAYFEEIRYNLNLSSIPYDGGNTTGGGYFTPGYYTITATPSNGFCFRHWNDSITTNPRTIYLDQDTFLIAVYEGLPYSLTLYSVNEDYGSVEGSGSYPYHSHVQIHALPFEHHHFVKWWSPQNPDEILYNSTETITMTGDMVYHAYFAIDTYHVAVQSNNVLYGGVTGGGTFQYGEPCTVEATAYSGYSFVRWSNGVYYNPYTFVPTADVDLTAYFADEGSIVNLSISVNDPNMGSVIGGGPYAVGMVAELEAVPNPGYHFEYWSDGNSANPRQIVMTQDISLTAYFAPGGVGIDDIDNEDINIYVQNGRIVVDGAEGETVRVFDILGRPVKQEMLTTGVYLVKVGNHPAHKVVVLR